MENTLKKILLTGEHASNIEIINTNQFKIFITRFNNTDFTKGCKQTLHIETYKIQYKINSNTKLYKEIYKLLWERLENTLVNEYDEIEEDYLFFNIGDDTDMIWHWFEDFFDISIGKDILNQ
jgi:hypothetical protein